MVNKQEGMEIDEKDIVNIGLIVNKWEWMDEIDVKDIAINSIYVSSK